VPAVVLSCWTNGRGIALVGCLVLLATATAGCLDQAGGGDPSSLGLFSQTSLRSDELYWEQISAQAGTRETAIAIEEGRCLRSTGYRFPDAERELAQYPLVRLARPNVPGLKDLPLAEARRWGYMVASVPNPPEDPQTRYVMHLGKRQARAYGYATFGKNSPTIGIRVGGYLVKASTQGCLASAREAVAGSLKNYVLLTYVPQQPRTYIPQAWEQPQAHRALMRYKACLHSAGVSVKGFDGPDDLVALGSSAQYREGETQVPSSEERGLAVIDSRCRAQTHLYDQYRDAFVAAAAKWLVANRNVATKLLAMSNSTNTRALKIIAGYDDRRPT
jgi:hypothetical protein